MLFGKGKKLLKLGMNLLDRNIQGPQCLTQLPTFIDTLKFISDLKKKMFRLIKRNQVHQG